MRFQCVFALVASLALCATAIPTDYVYSGEYDYEDQLLPQYNFMVFKRTHGRTYDDADEERMRFDIFRENYDLIHHWNQGNHSFKLGINQFADMTAEEYHGLMLGTYVHHRVVPENFVNQTFTVENAPKSVDWRTQGKVNAVKDQGQCGSCYAFSAVQAIESAWAIKTGKLLNLAEQQVVDCDQVDSGCNGGLMDNVFDYVKNAGGLEQTADYAYVARDEKCNVQKGEEKAPVTSFVDVNQGDNAALMAAVAQQPVSVAINAESYQFQFYESGVFDWADCPNGAETLDHGVGVVGYGTENGKDYWIVRNSWGASWGENGYIRFARGANVNQCGILDQPSYPVV